MNDLSKTGTRFVAPLRESSSRVVEAEVIHELPAPPQTILPRATHLDRALGFRVATLPLALAVGFTAALLVIVGWQVPILSLLALLAALAGFVLTWGIAFALHTFVSPDGALFLHTVLIFRLLREEQKERHRRYRKHDP